MVNENTMCELARVMPNTMCHLINAITGIAALSAKTELFTISDVNDYCYTKNELEIASKLRAMMQDVAALNRNAALRDIRPAIDNAENLSQYEVFRMLYSYFNDLIRVNFNF